MRDPYRRMKLSTESLAHSAVRRPWRTLVDWVVARLPVA